MSFSNHFHDVGLHVYHKPTYGQIKPLDSQPPTAETTRNLAHIPKHLGIKSLSVSPGSEK